MKTPSKILSPTVTAWLAVTAWMALIFWLSAHPDLRVLDVFHGAALWLDGFGLPGPALWLDNLGLAQRTLTQTPGTFAYLVEHILRKGAHVTAYAVLALLSYRAAVRTPRSSARPALWAAAVTLLYAVSDEVHQGFVTERDGRLADVGYDAAGAILALWLLAHRTDPGHSPVQENQKTP